MTDSTRHPRQIELALWERVQSALQNASAKRRGVAHIASHDRSAERQDV